MYFIQEGIVDIVMSNGEVATSLSDGKFSKKKLLKIIFTKGAIWKVYMCICLQYKLLHSILLSQISATR